MQTISKGQEAVFKADKVRIKNFLSRGNLCPSQKKLKTEPLVQQSQLLTNERWVLQESNNSLQKCAHGCGVFCKLVKSVMNCESNS